MKIRHEKITIYIACLMVVGIIHHLDHVLRYDHSGWPFRPEISPFTFSLLVYPVIVSLFIIKNKMYRVCASGVLALLVILAHIFLETPIDQFSTWAHNSSSFVYALGHPNLLNIQSVALGYGAVILGMMLNIGIVTLPFLFWKEEKFQNDKITRKN
ncbi:MAG: hypothetical protein Q7K40_03245 [bacterium]|nr:hypothetical protein [bacterium]